jgi:type IV pilus assembly protein PilW
MSKRTDNRSDMASGRLAIKAPRHFGQTGLTMVELLVALVISLMIALAAIASLIVTRRGFNTVDSASQLRDNGRFAADLIQRLVVQSGFKDVHYAATSSTGTVDIAPDITGFNNAAVSALTLGTDAFNGTFSVTTTTAINGSDILILRNQLVDLEPGPPASGKADGSMIDCNGNSLTGTGTAPTARDERAASILYVDNFNGEPSLMCQTIDSKGGMNLPTQIPQPIIVGVETFQVLYGTQGVTAGTAPTSTYGMTFGASAPAALTIFTPNPPTTADSTALTAWQTAWANWTASINQVPDKYLRADQLRVASSTVDTNANWRRVRSVRIGLILRGPPNSAQNTDTSTYYPFGRGKSSGTAAPGSSFADSTNDPGSAFTAPTDGRLRQVLTFSVHLRNDQSL